MAGFQLVVNIFNTLGINQGIELGYEEPFERVLELSLDRHHFASHQLLASTRLLSPLQVHMLFIRRLGHAIYTEKKACHVFYRKHGQFSDPGV